MKNLAHPTTSGEPRRERGFTRAARRWTLFTLLVTSVASADPVTYTGFTITDGQLGKWKFHSGLVYLTFQGDTKDVQFMQFTLPSGATADADVITQGTAKVTIVAGDRVEHATFDPNQVIVASDLGDSSDLPHVGARGMGFSSLTATGLEPAYPLGIEDGTLDWGDIFPPGIAAPELGFLAVDLQNSSAFGGRAWSCVGFPDACQPPNPLHTNRGDLTLENPYSLAPSPGGGNDSLSAGFFVVDVGGALGRPPDAAIHGHARGKHPIVYRAYTISDVQLGNESFFAAQVYFTYEADASKVKTFDDGPSSYGFINDSGRASLTIVSGATVRTATFRRGEIYVYYDIGSAALGFGSKKGGRGYPLSLTGNHDVTNGLVENSTIEAVSDLSRVPADAALYTPATATLRTDLTNATVLGGAANSCVAFDPITSACADLTPIGLKTSAGLLYLSEDFYEDETQQDPPIPGPYSIQWGVFWSELGGKCHGEHDGRDHDRDDDRDDDD